MLFRITGHMNHESIKNLYNEDYRLWQSWHEKYRYITIEQQSSYVQTIPHSFGRRTAGIINLSNITMRQMYAQIVHLINYLAIIII